MLGFKFYTTIEVKDVKGEATIQNRVRQGGNISLIIFNPNVEGLN